MKEDRQNKPDRLNRPERPDWEVKMGEIQFQGFLPLMFWAIVIAGLCFGQGICS